jgi:hypothetical protein
LSDWRPFHLAQLANVQAVYMNFDSTVIVIASAPLVIWNLLPKDWDLSFFEFDTSVNNLGRTGSLTSQKVENNQSTKPE